MLSLATLTRLHNIQRAVAKHKEALLQSLEKPLRELGYRVEPLPVSSEHPMDTDWSLGTVMSAVKEQAPPSEHQLICPGCDRTFARPVHLGRHRQARHAK
jgi:hypothetical protein